MTAVDAVMEAASACPRQATRLPMPRNAPAGLVFLTQRNTDLPLRELSPASVRILLRKRQRLAADFADLAALDVHVPSRDKTSVAVLLACRRGVLDVLGLSVRGAA